MAEPISPAYDAVQDPARTAEIAALNIPMSDEVLQATVEDAALRLHLPIGLVTIVVDGSQRFAARHGVGGWVAEANGTPVEWSFCANSVRTGQDFVVEDAETHPLVRDNPMVTIEGIRCYAGVPLVTRNGYVLGNLCVAGTERRTFSDDDLRVLRDLARGVVAHLESRRDPSA